MARKPAGKKANGGGAVPALAGFAAGDLEALAASLSRLSDSDDDAALDAAQEIAFEAMKAPTRRKRIALAKKALAVSPMCADAHLVLGEEADSEEEAIGHYRRAVAAGEKALGEAIFAEEAGSFWLLIQTRPYMRARHILAMTLWETGARDEAIDHYRDLLRLNPNDNQGVRYLLMDALLALGRDAEAAALLKSYARDGAAAWAWSGALLAFRRGGDKAAARKALAKALGVNPHVPAYLLGRTALPERFAEYVVRGGEDEAAAYADGAVDAWAAAPGARAWLAAQVPADEAPGAGDPDRIDEAVLALLALGLHDGNRTSKTFDRAALDRLHARGLIGDPAGRAASLVLTDAGRREALRLRGKLFGGE